MAFITILITAVVSVTIGYLLARRRKEGLIFGQAKRKQENKQKILDFLRENDKVTNNNIEKLLGVGVSDATATRYLNELEKEQKIRQIGTTGNAVYYVLK